MLRTVGSLGVPIVLMHMRGTPETMQTMTDYDDVVSEVAHTLLNQSALAASRHSVHRWIQIVDPGIGFAKTLQGNILLLRNMAHFRSSVQNLPVLIGTSRKGFLGSITGAARAADRDPATIASCVAALCLESPTPETDLCRSYTCRCNILRVHNVADCKQAALIMDAIRNA
jgi:dihydropteroate synthase